MKRIFLPIVIGQLILCFCSNSYAQCEGNPKHIGWLSKMLRIQFTILEPSGITYTSKPSSIYEVPFGFIAFASFVKADNRPYFYVWTSKDHFKESTDFKKGDQIIFYLSNGNKIESTCLSDYNGIKGQTISFYELQKSDLDQLSKIALDSIYMQSHLRLTEKSDPEKVEDKPIILRKFSKNNIENMQEWAACLLKKL